MQVNAVKVPSDAARAINLGLGATPASDPTGAPAATATPVTPMDVNASAKARIQQLFKQQFGQLARNRAEFHALMQKVFGGGYDKQKAEQFRQLALRGDFSWLPPIRFLDNSAMNGAQGGYDKESGVVFLNSNLLQNPSLAASVYVEEVGHHLDAELNVTDTRGDEGEMFRRVLAGENLTTQQIQAIRNENDAGYVQVDGKTVKVENFFKKIGGFFKKTVKSIGNSFTKILPMLSSVLPIASLVFPPLAGLVGPLAAISKFASPLKMLFSGGGGLLGKAFGGILGKGADGLLGGILGKDGGGLLGRLLPGKIGDFAKNILGGGKGGLLGGILGKDGGGLLGRLLPGKIGDFAKNILGGGKGGLLGGILGKDGGGLLGKLLPGRAGDLVKSVLGGKLDDVVARLAGPKAGKFLDPVGYVRQKIEAGVNKVLGKGRGVLGADIGNLVNGLSGLLHKGPNAALQLLGVKLDTTSHQLSFWSRFVQLMSGRER